MKGSRSNIFALSALACAISAIGRRENEFPIHRGICQIDDGTESAVGGGGSVAVDGTAEAAAVDAAVDTAVAETAAVAVGEGGEKAADADTAAVAVGEGGEKAADADTAAVGPMKKRGNNCCCMKGIHNYSLPNIKINHYNNTRVFLGNYIRPRARVSFDKSLLDQTMKTDLHSLPQKGEFFYV